MLWATKTTQAKYMSTAALKMQEPIVYRTNISAVVPMHLMCRFQGDQEQGLSEC